MGDPDPKDINSTMIVDKSKSIKGLEPEMKVVDKNSKEAKTFEKELQAAEKKFFAED